MLRGLGLVGLLALGACASPSESRDSSALAATSGWQSTEIARRPELNDVDYETVSLAIDKQGGRHLAFVGDDQFVHYRGPSGAEKVFDEAPAEAVRPRLALGPDGEPQVAFTSDPWNVSGAPIMLGAHTASGWRVEAIGKTGDVDALAIDDSGTVHIASSDVAPSPGYWRATVSTRKPGAAFAHADIPKPITGMTSWSAFGLVVDRAGNESLLLATAALEIGGDAPTTHFARRSVGGAFRVERLSVDGSTGALTRDANGTLHAVVSSKGFSGTHPLYLRRGVNDTAWSVAESIDAFTTSYYSSIAVDTRGIAHVAFSTNTANAVMYAKRSTSGSWSTSSVFDGRAQLPSLALDPSGGPVIGYRSGPSYWLATR